MTRWNKKRYKITLAEGETIYQDYTERQVAEIKKKLHTSIIEELHEKQRAQR